MNIIIMLLAWEIHILSQKGKDKTPNEIVDMLLQQKLMKSNTLKVNPKELYLQNIEA